MIELWGGLECTVNRVGDRFFDQIVRTGHQKRIEDLDLISDLGIRTLRYPVLWERTVPAGESDWSWPDVRLKRMQELRIKPVIGLIHHGSGPKGVSLADPLFPKKLAAYAGEVARRYPWNTLYTPVNEPLTTARFSGLYGYWYPHAGSERDFVRALFHECRAIVLAMRQIRRVNTEARLIQTEDIGKVFSTPRLRYQANFENERRWITFDLLCGTVDRFHPIWSYLIYAGATEAEILWFRDNPYPPDILGINHYVTSDRYLDERLDLFPGSAHGGNGRECYADVEAVRVDLELPLGVGNRVQEVWERYKRPIVVTEVHLGGDQENQMLWFRDAWMEAEHLQFNGIDIRAVTAWTLFGAYDWHCLLRREEMCYERGVFDVSNGTPQPTLLAHKLAQIGQGQAAFSSIAQWKGWWRRPERVLYSVRNSSNPQQSSRHSNVRSGQMART